MKEWIEKKLEDVARIIDYRGKTPKKTDSGIPLITAKIVKNGRIEKPNEFIAEEDYDKWMIRGLPESGDVVMTTEAPLGEVAQIRDNNVALAQRIITLRGAKNILDNGYLKYFLQSNEGQTRLKARETGTTVTGIKQSELRKVLIPMPEIGTQRAIAEILYSLDDKIELNNQINENLEALAQAIFKHWFIDFEFPDKNGNPYKSSGGKMVESELGLIPEGWNVGELQEILEVKGGGTPSTKNEEFWDGDINWTSPKDLSKLKFPVLLETEKKITASGLKKISSGLLPKGTLLMSSRAPIGYLAITEIDTAINQGYIAINCKGSFDNLFMLFWLKQNIASVTAMANGSTFLEVNKANFKKIKIVIPKPNVHNIFVDHIKHMFELLTQNEKESRNLESLRDTILPRLISGTLELL
jgi:type I restriction enzyme S subunit